MAGKRKATELDAPGSAQPPPPQRWRGDRDDDDHSSLSDYGGDSQSDRATLGDADDERWSLSDGHVGSVDSSDWSDTGVTASNMMLDLNLNAPAEPSDLEEVAAAAAAAQTHSPPASDQATEMEVQPQSPPPTDQTVPATEVADHSVAAAAPAAPEMVVPAAASVWCSGCAREPASIRLVPVKHDCLCLPCRSNPFFRPRCLFCDAPAVEDSGED